MKTPACQGGLSRPRHTSKQTAPPAFMAKVANAVGGQPGCDGEGGSSMPTPDQEGVVWISMNHHDHKVDKRDVIWTDFISTFTASSKSCCGQVPHVKPSKPNTRMNPTRMTFNGYRAQKLKHKTTTASACRWPNPPYFGHHLGSLQCEAWHETEKIVTVWGRHQYT